MSWQILIWNIFVWTFTGIMITLNHASLWWLILPAMFTGYNNGKAAMEQAEKDEVDKQLELIDEIAKKAKIKL
jgi:hypothetical protein